MIASDVTDFPLPDSPTNPTDSPVAIKKLKSRTAGTEPKLTLRLAVSSRVMDMLQDSYHIQVVIPNRRFIPVRNLYQLLRSMHLPACFASILSLPLGYASTLGILEPIAA